MKTYLGWFRRAVSAGLVAAVMSSTSLIGLASSGQPLMGELVISGATDGQQAIVMVNGERAFTGRTVFSSDIITTSSTSNAIVNLGKSGRIELAPNSALKLGFSEKAISGNLDAGQVKVMNAADVDVTIQTKDAVVTGERSNSNLFVVNTEAASTNTAAEIGTVYLNSGNTVTKVSARQDDEPNWGKYAGPIALGGIALLGLIIITTVDDDEENATVSPTR